jgi:hypothetical protein
MSVKEIIKESMDRNPVSMKEHIAEELSKRVAVVLEAKMKESDKNDDDDSDDDDDNDDNED